MGCDIYTFVELKQPDAIWRLMNDPVFPMRDHPYNSRTHTMHPFDWRSYSMYGFLADVRNYSECPVIQPPLHALPADVSTEVREAYDPPDDHSANCLTVRQLLDYDYEQTFTDMRNGEVVTTVRAHLGTAYFADLSILATLAPDPENVRVVFWFDN